MCVFFFYFGSTHSFQAVSGVKYNWRQNDVKKYLRIKRDFHVDFFVGHVDGAPEIVLVCLVGTEGGVYREMEGESIGW